MNNKDKVEIEGERGLPSVNLKSSNTAKRVLLVVLACVLLVGTAGVIYLSRFKKAQAEAAKGPPNKEMQKQPGNITHREFGSISLQPNEPPPPKVETPIEERRRHSTSQKLIPVLDTDSATLMVASVDSNLEKGVDEPNEGERMKLSVRG
jgi:hypothetical protein